MKNSVFGLISPFMGTEFYTKTKRKTIKTAFLAQKCGLWVRSFTRPTKPYLIGGSKKNGVFSSKMRFMGTEFYTKKNVINLD